MFEILKSFAKTKVVTEKKDLIDLKDESSKKLPRIKFERCQKGCDLCIQSCPTKALTTQGVDPRQCINCLLCKDLCPSEAIELQDIPIITAAPTVMIGQALKERIRKVCKGSLHIRYVDAGACNGCDFEINALPNPVYDIQQYGIDFVASPRHADMLLVTGVVTRNLEIALQKTYEACPQPVLVVAVGTCACGGGIFKEAYAAGSGVDKHLPVDVFVPGCPPSPELIIKGILTAIGRY